MPVSDYVQQGRQRTRAGFRCARFTHRINQLLIYASLISLSLLFILPFVWMVSCSLKNDQQNIAVPPILIPNPPRWANYPEALTMLPWGRFAINTVARYALPNLIGTLASCALAAYGFSRIRWPGREIVFVVCIATMMVPFQVTMVPLFIVFRRAGWVNTYLPLTVPAYFGNAYFIFLLRQFFLTIPQELSDAARIDGCSELGILVRVILPLAKPALLTVGLFQFVHVWNDYLGPLIYLNDKAQMPIALAMDLLAESLRDIGYNPNLYGYLMAMSTCIVLPVLAVYFFTQRAFIEGVALTGIKA